MRIIDSPRVLLITDCDSLLEIGAQVNWKNAEGDTPLHAACRRGHDGTISILLVHGADVNMTGADSK
jgi:ankyrin repeat protein